MTPIIAVANQKGGVGKTTTAINLAACLAERNLNTLLVDCDPQGNASSGFGIAPDDRARNIYHLMNGDCAFEEACRPTETSHLSIIPSSIDLIAGEIEFLDEEDRFHLLKIALEETPNSFDFVILDAPPSLGLLTLNTLSAATDLIVPVQAEYYALEGLSMLTETLGRVQSAMNPDLSLLGILLTLVDRRTNLCRQVEEEVRSHFGSLVFNTVINRSIRLGEAPSYGRPVIEFAPDERSAQDYRNLAGEVLAMKGSGVRSGPLPGADHIERDESAEIAGSKSILTVNVEENEPTTATVERVPIDPDRTEG